MSASRLMGEHGMESRRREFTRTSVSSRGKPNSPSGLSTLECWGDRGVEGKEGEKGDGWE